MIDGMLVVDVHNHVGEFRGVWGLLRQTPEELLKRMDKNGIDVSVIFPFPSGLMLHEDFRSANDYILNGAKEDPKRLIPFCTVTPMHGQFAVDEMKRCAEMGAKGIKLYPPGHGFYPLDSPLMDPIMTEAQRLGLVVLTHSDFNTKICTPFHAARLAERFPEVPLIVAHFGEDPDVCHWVPDIVERTPNVILDTSCTPDIPESIYILPIEKIGAERVAFGSDTPTVSPEVNLTKLKVAEELYGLTENAKRNILGLTAARILRLDVEQYVSK